jgi:hypothetical protein
VDTYNGRCGYCRRDVPAEFQWIIEEALQRAREFAERYRLEQEEYRKRERERRFRDYLEQRFRTYIEAKRRDGRAVSRTELLAWHRIQSGLSWIDCRDDVDYFLSQNTLPVERKDNRTAREIMKRLFSEEGRA